MPELNEKNSKDPVKTFEFDFEDVGDLDNIEVGDLDNIVSFADNIATQLASRTQRRLEMLAGKENIKGITEKREKIKA
jgi:hypothetical protein